MKAKYLLLILGIFFCIGIKATEREIILYDCTDKEDWVRDERSISIVPTATIDGNTIRIYTDIVISNIQIMMKDSMGNVIYSSIDTSSSCCHIFEICDFPKHEYSFEIKTGEDSFYGFIIFPE